MPGVVATPPLNSTDQDSPEALYGRDAERARLRQIYDALLAGQGGFVLISGEAGIGKTALVEDLRRHAAGHSTLFLTGQCYDLVELSPYTPWIEILQQYDAVGAFPEIPEQLRPGVDLSDARSQQALFERGRDLFTAISELRPLVIVIEDAHWADTASLEALRYVGRWLANRPVLFIVTYRDEEQSLGHPLFSMLPWLVRDLQPERLELRRIPTAALDRLVAGRYGLPDGEHQRLVSFLAEFSSGNPFYALEILRSLEIDGLLERHHTGWRLGDIVGFRIPALLRQIMNNRLAAQDEQARGWLEIAAVIGGEVPFALWSQVCATTTEQLSDAFTRARDLALVREVPGRASFEFSHALFREALYERLPLPQRLHWHARVAEALAASPQAPADRIAHHFQMAGDARAVDWLIRAGEEAQARYAWQAAIERYRQAIAGLEGVPGRANDLGWLWFRVGALARFQDAPAALEALDRSERLGVESRDRVLATFSRFISSLVRSFSATTDEPLCELHAAVNAIGRFGPGELAQAGPLRTTLFGELRAPDAPWPAANPGLGTLALRLASTGRHTEAESAAREFLAHFDAPPDYGDPALVPYADAHTALGFVHTVQCQPDAAREALRIARDAYRRADDRRAEALGYFAELILVVMTFELHRKAERHRLAEEAAAAMRRAQGAFPSELPADLFAFEILWLEGDWERAVANARLAQAHMGASITLASIALARGEYDAVDELVVAALPDGPRTAPGQHNFLVRFNLSVVAASAALQRGDYTAASAWIDCIERWITWSEMRFGHGDLALLRAEYLYATGDLASAEREARRAIELSASPPVFYVLDPAQRLLAKLALAAGNLDAAREHAEAALVMAREVGAAYEAALCKLPLAEALHASGEGEAAQTLLDEAAAVFERLGARPASEQAWQIREKLAAPSEARSQAGLSPRELEVLRLVAEGLTDAEVAERLFISRRTVSQHLRSIYGKLGVNSRVAATRFALDEGLI